MITELFFLILALLVTSAAPDMMSTSWPSTPGINFLIGMILFFIVIAGIALQGRYLLRYRIAPFLPSLAHAELIFFLTTYNLVLGCPLFFTQLPLIGNSLVLPALFSMTLYIIGLYIAHYTTSTMRTAPRKKEHALMKIRFILPFILPLLIFFFTIDITSFIFIHTGNNAEISTPLALIALGEMGCLFLALLIFFPLILARMWGCNSLPESPLKKRLDALCIKARFHHGGIKSWYVMRHAFNAAIIGIIPRYRYIMLTEQLIKHCSEDELEAIVCHEIGHSKKKHLIIYPILIAGMLVITSLFSLFFDRTIDNFFALHSLLFKTSTWSVIAPCAKILPFILIIVIYLRVVFGYFSRMFERQADLYAFTLDIPPEHMASALNSIASFSGNTHHIPSWHHGSIADRIAFIEKAANTPHLVTSHDKKVRYAVLALLITTAIGFIIMLSPILEDVPFIGSVGNAIEEKSFSLSIVANSSLRRSVAKQYAIRYKLGENTSDAFADALTKENATAITGVAEFYAAQILLDHSLISESAVVMVGAWKSFDFSSGSSDALDDFVTLTQHIILKAALSNTPPSPAIITLQHILLKRQEQLVDF